MDGRHGAPRWAVWMMKRMMTERELRVALDELGELHALWSDRLGRVAADRRYRREIRQYPLRLIRNAVSAFLRWGPWAAPGAVRFGLRSLVRSPGLATAIVLTVGVGIGGCTLVFSVVDVLFLRPLPYPDADRIAWIYTDSPPNRWPFSVADLQALQAQQASFASVAAYTSNARTLVTSDGAELIPTAEPTPGFFELLGLPLLSGRTARPEEGGSDASGTVVVTSDFASRHLDAVRQDRSDALGARVVLDDESYDVIGVLPSRFGPIGQEAEVFPTLRLATPERKGPFFLRVFGRLAEDTDPAVAGEELRAINARLFPVWADSYQDRTATWGMEDLAVSLQGDSGRLLTILMGAVAMLLLVAVTNAANLLLARVSARHREIAVRRALGASRGRIASGLLTESMILASGGIVVGLLLARLGVGLLPTLAGSYLPRLDEVRMDGSSMAFALTLALGCGLLFGLVPTLRGAKSGDVSAGLRSGGRSATQSAGEQGLQRLLVGGQLAVVVPLLAGAGLLLSSFVRLQGVDPGFDAEDLVTMRVTPSRSAFPDPETRNQFWTALADRVSGLPGVASVGLANGRPPAQSSGTNNFDLEDRPTPPGLSQPSVPWILADPGYFETLGIRLLAGRMFTPLDSEYSPEVAIVDEAWAERFFPGETVVGRRFKHGGCAQCDWTTVVGVVAEVQYQGLGGAGEGTVYQPDPARYSTAPFFFVRARGQAESLVAAIRTELAAVDGTTPMTQVGTGQSLLSGSLTQPRHLTVMLGTFSTVALLLAIIGLYGITAYSVQRRKGDIAVRLALGGSPSAVLGMILRQGLVLAALGLTVGLGLALVLTRVMSTLLHEVSPRDPVTLLGVAALMMTVSAVACVIPGRRAVRVDPSSTLREE